MGGGNDRLYGILCTKIGKPQWIIDDRFKTNALRVKNRDVLEELIETETRKKSTQEWLEVLEGCGMRESRMAILSESLLTGYSLCCHQRRPNHFESRAW